MLLMVFFTVSCLVFMMLETMANWRLSFWMAEAMAIAKGEYVPAKDEPKVWFESVRSMSQVLSEENQALLKLILETHPKSLVELAERSGRATSNLSRTLRTMERYGLVHFEQGANRQLAPKVDYSGVAFEMSFSG